MTESKPGNANWAFVRYEELRGRLPEMGKAGDAASAGSLGGLTDRFDAFVFDSFGVLNVGDTPIAGAPERIAALRRAGKQVFVLTNAATSPLAALPKKYADLGFDFSPEEIVSSREILQTALLKSARDRRWLVVAPEFAEAAELRLPFELVRTDRPATADPAGIILLSSKTIDDALSALMSELLTKHDIPLMVGNPDLLAPRDGGFSVEPGFYAHKLADELDITPEFFGKPYLNAFQEVRRRMPVTIPPERIAMIGDTLHTDILGASAAGIGSVLVTGHGVLKNLDVRACIEHSGIIPDYVIPTI